MIFDIVDIAYFDRIQSYFDYLDCFDCSVYCFIRIRIRPSLAK